MISDMTTLILIALIATAALVAATIREVHADGRGSTPPPASHPTDPRFAPPASFRTRT